MADTDATQGQPITDVAPEPPPPENYGATKKRWPNDPAFYVNLAGVVGVLVYAGIAAWQACLTREQLTEMIAQSATTKKQLDLAISSERPYVLLDGLKIKEERSDGPPPISAVWKNVGKSPAILIEAFYHLNVGKEIDERFDLKTSVQMPQRYTIEGGKISEPISFSAPFHYVGAPPPGNRTVGWLIGEYSYADMFGSVYTQCFRFYFTPDPIPEQLRSQVQWSESERFTNIGFACHGGGKREEAKDFKPRFQSYR